MQDDQDRLLRNFALQLKVPKKPPVVKKFYKLSKTGKSLGLGGYTTCLI